MSESGSESGCESEFETIDYGKEEEEKEEKGETFIPIIAMPRPPPPSPIVKSVNDVSGKGGNEEQEYRIDSLQELRSTIEASLEAKDDDGKYSALVTEPFLSSCHGSDATGTSGASGASHQNCKHALIAYSSKTKTYDWTMFAMAVRHLFSKMMHPTQKRILWLVSEAEVRISLNPDLTWYLGTHFHLWQDGDVVYPPITVDGLNAWNIVAFPYQRVYEFKEGHDQFYASMEKILGKDWRLRKPTFCEFLRWGGSVPRLRSWTDQLWSLGVEYTCKQKDNTIRLSKKKTTSIWKLLRRRFESGDSAVQLNPTLIELKEREIEFAERGYQILHVSDTVAWIYKAM